MRLIEAEMNSAISRKVDWKKSNTRVIYSPVRNASEVYLHDNLIAIVNQDAIQLFDGGWQSNTTKSRLNAILYSFGLPNERVYQKDFTWYLRMKDGTSIPFFSSMRLA